MKPRRDNAHDQVGEVGTEQQNELHAQSSTSGMTMEDVLSIAGMTPAKLDLCRALASVPPDQREQINREYARIDFEDRDEWLRRRLGLARPGRGKAKKTIALIEAAIRILEEIQPASIRAVCYRLFVAGLIPSMAVKYTSMVSKQLVWAREQGILPWEHVVDETREAERIQTWSDPAEIIDAAVRGYRKDYWATQPEWIEVWSEKGTIRGTLLPVLNKYGVTFRVMHGYGSATSIHGIAEETAQNDKRLTVLYVGDRDPSGMNMSEVDLPGRMERYEGDADIVRVALNDDDVAPGADLPSFEIESKSKDPRYKWFLQNYGRRCWELDALSPVVLRKRVEAAIFDRLDLDAWTHSVKIERAETESMGSILKNWKRTISRPVKKYSPRGAA